MARTWRVRVVVPITAGEIVFGVCVCVWFCRLISHSIALVSINSCGIRCIHTSVCVCISLYTSRSLSSTGPSMRVPDWSRRHDCLFYWVYNTKKNILHGSVFQSVSLVVSTLPVAWARDKWTPFRRRYFQVHQCLNSELKFTAVCSLRSNQQFSIIGLNNGLAASRRQAIIWTNDD